MRKYLCLLLCLSLLFCLFGCSKKAPEVPAEFFYWESNLSNDPQKSVIGSEIRETASHPGYIRTLDLYLKGPESNALKATFPRGTRIVSLSQAPGSISLVLSDEFASLTGIELSIACICLAKTVIQLTGCNDVTVQAETLPLDGEKNITLDNSGVLFYDNYYGQTESE